MAMNRETRRMLQTAGRTMDGRRHRRRVRERASRAHAPAAGAHASGPSPLQFLREVRGELRKVAWPTRSEVINYSIIVLVAVIILTALRRRPRLVLERSVFNLFGE